MADAFARRVSQIEAAFSVAGASIIAAIAVATHKIMVVASSTHPPTGGFKLRFMEVVYGAMVLSGLWALGLIARYYRKRKTLGFFPKADA
jgi:hypothetical protein